MVVGTLLRIQRTPFRGAPCEAVEHARLVEDFGLDGDRHARPASSRQVVLVFAEVLDDLGLPYGATREQLTIAGLHGDIGDPLAAGTVLDVGAATLELVRERVPCAVMERVRRGLEDELRGRGGWCARVLRGGDIGLGDRVVASAPVAADPQWLAEYLLAITEWEESTPEPAAPGGWGFPQRLAHLVAWDELVAGRLADGTCSPVGGLDPVIDIDAFNAAAVARLLPGGSDDLDRLWVQHDTWSTAVVGAARLRPRTAEPWVRALTTHYREHS